MAVISVSITESSDQISSGIPRIISISTNIISNVFYTLDGSDPNLFSQIYTDPITLPTNLDPLVVKIFATNGIDYSPIISQEYSSDSILASRHSRPATSALPGEIFPNKYPFGNGDIDTNSIFLDYGNTGQTVNDPNLDQIPNGFDGYGNPDGYTNLPLTEENYKLKFSEKDSLGQYGKGIGTVPGKGIVPPATSPPEQTDRYASWFDPRAMVIFQDVSKENPLDPPHINRQYFTLESTTTLDGSYLYNAGPDAAVTSGSFVRSHFNPRDNTITYYYFDSRVSKWIISKAPFQPKSTSVGQLYNIFPARTRAIGMVYQWRPFARRVLF
jgi:hypothetical protein